MRRIILTIALLCSIPAVAQTMTTYTGNILDLQNVPVTSGRISFTLTAPYGTISGIGSFVATTVSCMINATGNPVATSDGVSPCTVINNTALTPTGTSYRICLQPNFASPGSCFYDYATGGTKDISTIAPTLMSGPFNYGGPAGPPGPIGPIGGSLSYPGVTGNGANGINVSGTVAAAAANVSGVGAFGSISAPNLSYKSVDSFADSIGQGTGATTFMAPGIKGQPTTWQGDSDYATATYSSGPTAYAYLLQSDYGNAGHNYSRGGDTAEDMAWHVAIWAHPTLQQNPVRTATIGTNDNSLCGTSANCQDTTLKTELFSAADATIPDALKVYASAATRAGTWVADARLTGAMSASTVGATLTATVQSSTGYVYVAYQKCDNTISATGTITVNSVAGSIEPNIILYGLGSSAIYYNNGTSFASGSGAFSHCSLALARNLGVLGSNLVKFTAGGSGGWEIYWVAGAYTAPAGAIAPPLYVVGGVPYEAANAGQPGVGQYNTIANTVYGTMQADGNNVKWADVEALMNTTTDFTGGTQATGDAVCGVNSPNGSPWAATWLTPLHPGDGGHCHIYEAFHNVLNTLPVQSQALNLWAGPSGTITGANSLGGSFGADGGVNGIGASTNLTLDNTGVAATAGISIHAPGGDQFQIQEWGMGNGLNLPTTFGVWDPQQTNMLWWTRSGAFRFLCFFGNPNTVNMLNCAGAGAVLTPTWMGVGASMQPLSTTIQYVSSSPAGSGSEWAVNNNGGGYVASGSAGALGLGTFTGIVGSETYTLRGAFDASGFGLGSGATTTADPFSVSTAGATKTTGLTVIGSVSAGTGMQHKRTSFTCATATFCPVTVTWTTAFADSSYTATCSVAEPTAGVNSNATTWISAKTAGGLTGQVYVNGASGIPAGSTLDCIGMHD